MKNKIMMEIRVFKCSKKIKRKKKNKNRKIVKKSKKMNYNNNIYNKKSINKMIIKVKLLNNRKKYNKIGEVGNLNGICSTNIRIVKIALILKNLIKIRVILL